jgi:uncharacterized protein YrrD
MLEETMVLEASRILKVPILDATGVVLGKVDTAVYLATEGRLYGFQVAKPGVLTRFAGVEFSDVLSLNQHSVIVDTIECLQRDMKEFDKVAKATGPIIGLNAKTESGKKLGKISDLLLDAESGFIVRFYIRQLLQERIIPRQFVVSITPREVIFKDVVDTPLFDQVAGAEAAAA